jgi:hypothetical protein
LRKDKRNARINQCSISPPKNIDLPKIFSFSIVTSPIIQITRSFDSRVFLSIEPFSANQNNFPLADKILPIVREPLAEIKNSLASIQKTFLSIKKTFANTKK